MARVSKYSELPAAELDKSREREFPCCIMAGWEEIRSPKETDCWQYELRLSYGDGRKEFAIWCIRGFSQNDEKRARYALRQKAAGKGIKFIEIYHSSPPPTIAEVIEIEKFNAGLQKSRSEKTDVSCSSW